MSIVLAGASSGSVTIQEPAVAGTSVLTLPVGTGTVVVNNVNSAIVSSTSVASTSGTSIDFTGIPSWVKRITVMFNGVSLSSTGLLAIQIGSAGGIETTGYVGCGWLASSSYVHNSTRFVLIGTTNAAINYSGIITLALVSGNTWVESGTLGGNASNYFGASGGVKTLSDTLTQIRITSTTGTDTFDAGTINILYE
jgi:hypothetical protein